MNGSRVSLASQRENIEQLIATLETTTQQEAVETVLKNSLSQAPAAVVPNSNDYYSIVTYHLYRFALKHYQCHEQNICVWRYIKNLSSDQLNHKYETDPELQMMDQLLRTYFYSDPLDDLTCIFIPINNDQLIKKYVEWIKSYFYDVNYPTSLLWLYALDSSLASLFPDEIIFFGQRTANGADENILIPNFDYSDALLIKRFSEDPTHYVALEGVNANNEFRQIFNFLQREYKDRCLSRTGKQEDAVDDQSHNAEWEKFEDVLRFGVSDRNESGCTSFSDLRSSTEFLKAFGKDVYLNEIQQPFFEKTKLISKQYNGRIDKFMGDNVMCVFLNSYMDGLTAIEKEESAIISNFLALFMLCKVLFQIVSLKKNFADSNLGLRSGVTYGSQILRSNLGNELVRDFTVTGETVNLAARLEHISVQELIIHNEIYFAKAIERFPQIHELITVNQNFQNLNPETGKIIDQFTLFQNILSNLEKLGKVKFDIRFNDRFYEKLRQHLSQRGYIVLNADMADKYGYEEYDLDGFIFRFYFSFYNPKGFSQFKKIWILPLDPKILENLDLGKAIGASG